LTRNYKEEANKIQDNFPGFYLQLNIDLPDTCMQEAEAVYDAGYFAYHKPSLPGHGEGAGWYASCLHGLGWDKIVSSHRYGYPGNFADKDVPMHWTEVCELAPDTTRFFKEEFPLQNCKQKYKRLRFMLLKPDGVIPKHFDSLIENNGTIFNSINFAVNQPDNCYVRKENTKTEIPYIPGKCFLFDSTVAHTGQNNSDQNRFHILVQSDAEWRDDFWKIFVESFEQNYDGNQKYVRGTNEEAVA